MSTPKVARGKVVPLRPESEPVTLADVVVTWEEGGFTRSATGQQITRLLTRATEEIPFGCLATGHDVFIAGALLKGLASLVFPDARDLDDLGEDTRFMISETLRKVAALVHAEQLDAPDRPRGFVVRVQRDSGLQAPTTPVETAR